MTMNNKNRRKLVRNKPAPFALEARIMFDAAAVDTAMAAKNTADVPPPEAAATVSGPSIPPVCDAAVHAPAMDIGWHAAEGAAQIFTADAGNASLAEASMRAEQIIREFLDSDKAEQSLFSLFNAGQSEPSQAWKERAQALRAEVLEGSFSIQVKTISNDEIGGVFAAFAAHGLGGKPTIFINQDWLERQPGTDAVSRVLIEEFGHGIDQALNAERDTAGDEGEAFAALILNASLSDSERARIATENDYSTIHVNGQAIEIEEASITFSAVYQGTPSALSEEANEVSGTVAVAGTNFKFTSGNPSDPYFSGNNVAGTLSYVDTATKTVKTINGVVSRLVKTGSTVEGLYFYAFGSDGKIGTGDTGETAYLLCLDPGKFAPNGTYKTSSDPVDTAMNKLIVPNSAPVAANDSAAMLEDALSAVTGNLLANDTDANGDALRITQFVVGGQAYAVAAGATQSATLAGIGTFTIGSDGSYSFSPVANYAGAVPAVTYTVSDGAASTTGSFSVRITPVNDAPAGTDKSLSIKLGTAYTFSAADFGFSDANDTPANTFSAVQIKTLPVAGTLTLNSIAVTAGQEIAVADISRLKFTSSSAGSASFTFQVRDNGGTSNGGIDLDQSPNTISFTINAVNQNPVAGAGTATAVEAGGVANATAGSDAAGNLITSFASDPDAGDTLTLASVSSAAESKVIAGSGSTSIQGIYGTLTIAANGGYTYQVSNTAAVAQALLNNSGTDVFRYTVKDAAGLTSTNTFTVTVSGRNDAPVAVADFNTAKEPDGGTSYTGVASGNVLANDTDVDAGDTKTVVGLTATATASATSSGNSNLITITSLGTLSSNKSADYVNVGDVLQVTSGSSTLYDKNPSNLSNRVTVTSVNASTKTITLSTTVSIPAGATIQFWEPNPGGQISGSNYFQTDGGSVASSNSSATVFVSNITGSILTGMTVTGTGVPARAIVGSGVRAEL
ncbi:Ig-like domain-containing protein [Noviherbaspirillum sp. CPCC 100848]|uniref:Ig-like domain-containing protein n=1 Tax=Noviherbaspirillum album TaxID=3080276 RepID=A0ABU6JA53_9BURK|nr:Ig-like domain-containing protein [Noviherbaspirillum sp. CPCC 100848]MEC4720530.1 Ig-like domain-containing protein [Noviherbaspirillum sp. CPCC 100848]